jgi:nitrite reductase/ring-hydroxylating ferredoxin subunit
MSVRDDQARASPSSGLSRYVVARADELQEGDRRIVQVGGREVGIYRLNGKFYAVLNRCPHLGGPLCKGGVVSEIYASVPGDVRGNASRLLVTCPWHNWEFDVNDGQSYFSPKGPRARMFPVGLECGQKVASEVEAGHAQRVPGPFKAEVLPVAIEADYLVITMRPQRQATI